MDTFDLHGLILANGFPPSIEFGSGILNLRAIMMNEKASNLEYNVCPDSGGDLRTRGPAFASTKSADSISPGF
jgi:hypothetical protein